MAAHNQALERIFHTIFEATLDHGMSYGHSALEGLVTIDFLCALCDTLAATMCQGKLFTRAI